METKYRGRYLVTMSDSYDSPRHQDTKEIWTDNKMEAHKLAVNHVGLDGDHLRFSCVLDTKTDKRVLYSWFAGEFNKTIR